MKKAIRHLAYLLLALLSVVLIAAGCKSGSDGEKLSQADLERQAVDSKVNLMLVEAQDAFHQGAFGVALALTDSAEHYAPELADTPFLRGLIYTKMRLFDKARFSYEKVLELDPDYHGVKLNLGSTALRQGRPRDALKWYRKEQEAYSSPAILLQMGRAYAELGVVDSAKQAYLQAIAADSSYATAYFRLSEVYKDEGELELALEYSRRGLGLDPDNLNYRYMLGSLLLLEGQLEEAEDHLQQVVRNRAWHYWAHYNLGQALMRLDRRKEGQYFLDLADSLKESVQEIENWRSLAEMNPDQLMLWVNYGDALRRAGRIDEAIEAHHIAMSLAPRNIALQNNLANLYLMHGDTAWAIAGYRRVLHQDPTVADAWLNLGMVYASMGKTEAAEQSWENVLKFNPGDSTAKAYLETLSD
ncbi:MAG: tetratricopeptide repeat protein [Candidatus Neomarinimicrobiota bacterium]